MKVQVKRLKTVRYPNPHDMDSEFVNGLLLQMPEVGEGMIIDFFSDRWRTTDVKRISFVKGLMVVNTRNSVYHFKAGWKDN